MNRNKIKVSPLPWRERIEVRGPKRIFHLFLALIFGLVMSGCVTSQEELHAHGDMTTVKTYPKNYVHPLLWINLEKVTQENRGLKVLEENATTVHDYYRGGVQEKAEGEKYIEEGKWEDARIHLEKSNWFLRVVLKYLPEDEAYRNIYGDQVVIFLPNLLMADNYLKLIKVYKALGNEDKAIASVENGKDYLSESLKSVKTDWGFQIKKGLEETLPKK